MGAQTQSKASVQTKQSRFLFAFTVCTWIVAVSLSIYYYQTLRTGLAGAEWLGSPLFGLPLLAVFTTGYYFAARNKPSQPTVHFAAWSLLLLLVTTANMLTLAWFVFGEWKRFQWFPVMGAFQLLLIVLGVHFSLKGKSRGPVYILLVWTSSVFFLAVSTCALLGAAFQQGNDMWRLGYVAGSGAGVWTALMLVAYLGFKSRFTSWPDALAGWAWGMCLGSGVSLAVACFVLTRLGQLYTFYVLVGTLSFAGLVTALRMFTRDHRKLAGA